MKSLLDEEIEAAQTELSNASKALADLLPSEAIEHLRSLRAICDVLIELLDGVTEIDNSDTSAGGADL